jgi:hypothetical protein
MASYWGNFSEPGILRPATGGAVPAVHPAYQNAVALKAGAGNRSGKVLREKPAACACLAPTLTGACAAGQRCHLPPV